MTLFAFIKKRLLKWRADFEVPQKDFKRLRVWFNSIWILLNLDVYLEAGCKLEGRNPRSGIWRSIQLFTDDVIEQNQIVQAVRIVYWKD